MVTIYIKKGEYNKALETGKKYPNDKIIQNQIVTIYKKKKEYDKKLGIDEKISNFITIQSELENFITEKLNYNELNIIRSKLLLNTITLNDINLLNNIKDEIDENIYLLILAAIYERLNLKKKCISLLKTVQNFDNQKIKQLIQEIERNKIKFYNIEKWDSIIGWSIDIDTYLSEKQKEQIINEPIKKTVISPNLDTKESKKKSEKETKKVNIISGSFSKKDSKKLSKNPIEKKQEKDELTIYESLNNQYKQMVYYLKLQYYKEMYNTTTRKDATFKYDRLEEILCQKVSNKNAFRQLLLMFIGAGYSNIIENYYQEEYQILSSQINKKKEEIKLLTKKG